MTAATPAAEVATDRMMLATPAPASVPAKTEPDSASSPAGAPVAGAGAASAGAAAVDSVDAPVDDEAESLALARQLMEEEVREAVNHGCDVLSRAAAGIAQAPANRVSRHLPISLP